MSLFLVSRLSARTSLRRITPLVTSFVRTFTMAKPFLDAEKHIQRNPHPDFKKVESSRSEWDTDSTFRYTKTASPDWSYGDGANRLATAEDASKNHVNIDPYEEGRPMVFNYKLLISAIIPRPIAFVSTRSADGKTTNLAPFSYFNFVNHDPPVFVVGFASSMTAAKDTLRNVMETDECVINIISEPFVEAANAASVNAPYGVSEWDVTGLTPVNDCTTVKCARVKEAVFSIEAKLDFLKQWESKSTPGKKTGTMAVFEGKRFWVREDALNEEKNLVDPAVRLPPRLNKNVDTDDYRYCDPSAVSAASHTADSPRPWNCHDQTLRRTSGAKRPWRS